MPIPLGTVATEGKNISNSKIITIINTAQYEYFGFYAVGQAVNNTGNSICLSGNTKGNQSMKLFVAKFSESGQKIWGKQLRVYKSGSTNIGAVIDTLVTDSAGNTYAAGTLLNNFVSLAVPFVAKFDIDGNLIWQKKIYRPSAENQSISNLALMPNGTLLVTLYVGFSSTESASHLVNITTDGVLISERKQSGSYLYYDAVNNVYISTGTALVTSSTFYGFVEKYDTNFQLLSAKKSPTTNGSTLAWFFNSLDSSGNYYLTSPYSGLSVAKFSPSGSLIWHKIYTDSSGNPISTSLRDLQFDTSGSIYYSVSFNTTAKYWKTDTNGLLSYVRIMTDGSSSGFFDGPCMSKINGTKNNFNIGAGYNAYVLRTNGTTLGNYSIITEAGNRSYSFTAGTELFNNYNPGWTMTDYTPASGINVSNQIAVENLTGYDWETWADVVTGTTSIN